MAVQHAAMLELPIRAARARIVAPELFDQFLVAADDLHAALDLRFGWEPFTALAGALEKRGRRDSAFDLPYGPPC